MTAFSTERLLGELEVTLDLDVLIGARPDRDGPSGTPEAVLGVLAAHRVAGAAVASLRAALFDMASGNDEVLALAAERPEVVPVGTVDLRDPIGAAAEVDRLAAASVRAVRLFPDEQNVEAGFPSVRHVAKRAAGHGLVVLTGGDVRRFWRPFGGLGATVVFLDTHFYHLGDFLVAAADEPGFHTSTRLLNSPDALETVAARLGADRLVFGSRTPHAETTVPLLRLATSGLAPADVAAVAGGTARRLLRLDPGAAS
ncbi:amidohydrolase family protein [Actinomadura sp. NPDC048955]|uniref:amidohydrolase family protein n=1 Tax=Actinomadura TaxID=1988 RepID=UPI0021641107|nr:amidohydrolase family protein [Actinomadura glauciflava]MCR3744601.1 putative metal-dependent hydrolase, TIM-barrel fold [Actinomadura glauciflava]